MGWLQPGFDPGSSEPSSMRTYTTRVEPRFNPGSSCSGTRLKAMSIANILCGFRVSGIYPFNHNAVRPLETPSPKPSLAQKTGLKFIQYLFLVLAVMRVWQLLLTLPNQSILVSKLALRRDMILVMIIMKCGNRCTTLKLMIV